jgi:hypothetical protein
MPPRLDALHRTPLQSCGIRPAGSKFSPEGVRNRHGHTSAPDDSSRPTGTVPLLGGARHQHTREGRQDRVLLSQTPGEQGHVLRSGSLGCVSR